MKIFNQELTKELNDVDLNNGYLISGLVKFSGDLKHNILPEGNKTMVGNIVTVEDEIYIYIPYTGDELVENLRSRRSAECFKFINRGILWYEKLTETQKSELNEWYTKWLDVTETKIIPEKPEWLI